MEKFQKSGFCAIILISAFIAGCATVTDTAEEAAKGILGSSTRALEKGRATAIKQEFNCAYPACYDQLKKGLRERGSYIYADSPKKKMIAVYVTYTDTTPAGVFFKEVDAGRTQVEVSSPSTYAKEFIAKRVKSILEGTVEPGLEEKKEENAAATVADR